MLVVARVAWIRNRDCQARPRRKLVRRIENSFFLVDLHAPEALSTIDSRGRDISCFLPSSSELEFSYVFLDMKGNRHYCDLSALVHLKAQEHELGDDSPSVDTTPW